MRRVIMLLVVAAFVGMPSTESFSVSPPAPVRAARSLVQGRPRMSTGSLLPGGQEGGGDGVGAEARASGKLTSSSSSKEGGTQITANFLKRWDAAKAANRLPCTGTSGWRAALLDESADLLYVEDFLEEVVLHVRRAGGEMRSDDLLQALADEQQRATEQIKDTGSWHLECALPKKAVQDARGRDISMGEVMRSCSRLRLDETGEEGVQMVSLVLDEEETKSGTQVMDLRAGGTSAIRGSLQSVLDYAVDEVLEERGYKSTDKVILFDGVCNLCNWSVNFVLDHDIEEKFRFAALQSETGHALLRKSRRDPHDLSTMVLVEGGVVYDESDAVLRIGQQLNLPGNLQVAALAARLVIPKPIRDFVTTEIISKNRIEWFGMSGQCRLMDDELESRFLV